MKWQREETAVSYWDRGNWKKGTEEMIRLVIMVGDSFPLKRDRNDRNLRRQDDNRF